MTPTTKRATREAKQLFRLCLVEAKLDENRVRQVIGVVLRSRRRGYMTLLGFFRRLVELYSDRHTARVETAVPLPADLLASVQTRVESLYGSGTTTLFRDNSELIGGMRIRVGSDVYDGSIRSRLAVLENSFLLASERSNGY